MAGNFPAKTIEERAAAKVNLYLHVGGVRPDGLHDLASLFVFAETGDVITVEPADDLSLNITGPFGGPLKDEPIEGNLVWRAGAALRDTIAGEGGKRLRPESLGAAITLDKRLPIAAGIGGGSSDAAAALRALMRLWDVSLAPEELRDLAFRLGADVPACLAEAPVFVGGAGEVLTPGPDLPPMAICLINPLEPMPTGPIFRAFDEANPAPPSPVQQSPASADIAGVEAMITVSRNDLEPFAVARSSSIGAIIDMLSAQQDCFCARMSGSGATVFGLFTSLASAEAAAQRGTAQGWWSAAAMVANKNNGRE